MRKYGKTTLITVMVLLTVSLGSALEVSSATINEDDTRCLPAWNPGSQNSDVVVSVPEGATEDDRKLDIQGRPFHADVMRYGDKGEYWSDMDASPTTINGQDGLLVEVSVYNSGKADGSAGCRTTFDGRVSSIDSLGGTTPVEIVVSSNSSDDSSLVERRRWIREADLPGGSTTVGAGQVEAKISWSGTPAPGKTVTFDASGSSAGDGIESYSWDIQSYGPSSSETVDVTFDSEGSYSVDLTVTDVNGNTDTVGRTIDISEDNDKSGGGDEGDEDDETTSEGGVGRDDLPGVWGQIFGPSAANEFKIGVQAGIMLLSLYDAAEWQFFNESKSSVDMFNNEACPESVVVDGEETTDPEKIREEANCGGFAAGIQEYADTQQTLNTFAGLIGQSLSFIPGFDGQLGLSSNPRRMDTRMGRLGAELGNTLTNVKLPLMGTITGSANAGCEFGEQAVGLMYANGGPETRDYIDQSYDVERGGLSNCVHARNICDAGSSQEMTWDAYDFQCVEMADKDCSRGGSGAATRFGEQIQNPGPNWDSSIGRCTWYGVSQRKTETVDLGVDRFKPSCGQGEFLRFSETVGTKCVDEAKVNEAFCGADNELTPVYYEQGIRCIEKLDSQPAGKIGIKIGGASISDTSSWNVEWREPYDAPNCPLGLSFDDGTCGQPGNNVLKLTDRVTESNDGGNAAPIEDANALEDLMDPVTFEGVENSGAGYKLIEAGDQFTVISGLNSPEKVQGWSLKLNVTSATEDNTAHDETYEYIESFDQADGSNEGYVTTVDTSDDISGWFGVFIMAEKDEGNRKLIYRVDTLKIDPD